MDHRGFVIDGKCWGFAAAKLLVFRGLYLAHMEEELKPVVSLLTVFWSRSNTTESDFMASGRGSLMMQTDLAEGGTVEIRVSHVDFRKEADKTN